jgi:rod shape determining protein RodA
MHIFNFKAYSLKDYKFPLFIAALCLNLIGLRIIGIVQDPVDRLYEKQIFGILVGVFVVIAVSIIDYHFIAKFFIILYIINIGLLLLVFSPIGHAYYDARRWIDIPKLGQLQPSEFSKFLIVITMAAFFNHYKDKLGRLRTDIWLAALAAVPVLLVLLEPDLSTTIVLTVTFICMAYASEIPYKIVLPTLLIMVMLVAGIMWYVMQPGEKILIKDYQIDRFIAFLHPDDPAYADLNWQQNLAVRAILHGGLFGRMFSSTILKESLNCSIIPAIESDFIFSAVAEIFGFAGCGIVLGLELFIVIKGIKIARKAPDFLGRMIAIGISSIVALQTIVNVGVSAMLLPNTGIPLPFMSSGLSALMGNSLMLGVLMNVGLQHKVKEESNGESLFYGMSLGSYKGPLY